MCLVFAFAPALCLLVFHFLCCSVLQEISARFLFSYGSSSWIFPYKQVLLFLYPVEVPMYCWYYLCLCPYVLHFPLCLDIRYLCVHLPHRFAVYVLIFNGKLLSHTAPYGGDRAEPLSRAIQTVNFNDTLEAIV